jgi:hypothetical protein
VHVELAVVLHLGVVEEVSVNPKAGGHLLSFGSEFLDDAGDRDKLNLIGIADDDIVEQGVATRVIVAIDESGHDRHLLGVEGPCPLADERLGFCCASNKDEPFALNGKSPRLRHAGIHGIDLGVEYHQIGVAGIVFGALRFAERRGTQKTAACKAG